MEKAFEFFDTWTKSQQNFLESWLMSQKELMDNWLDSMKKIHMSFGTMVGIRGGSPQLFDLFNS
jgi:regulator of sigma D